MVIRNSKCKENLKQLNSVSLKTGIIGKNEYFQVMKFSTQLLNWTISRYQHQYAFYHM